MASHDFVVEPDAQAAAAAARKLVPSACALTYAVASEMPLPVATPAPLFTALIPSPRRFLLHLLHSFLARIVMASVLPQRRRSGKASTPALFPCNVRLAVACLSTATANYVLQLTQLRLSPFGEVPLFKRIHLPVSTVVQRT
jgi:hypothetical protein